MPAFRNVYGLRHFEARFGPVIAPGAPATAAKDLVGGLYRDILAETTAIVSHQWTSGIRQSPVKGFFFAGPPGIGKTSLSWRIAYELQLRFGPPEAECPAKDTAANCQDHVVMALIDGAEIARARYGESEAQIREVFTLAQSRFQLEGQRSVLLFDDVESILMARGSGNAKEWHFSQDSVFFHAVDELDTSHTVICLTSNRPDLVDFAILDRFLVYPLDAPDEPTLLEVGRRHSKEQMLGPSQTAALLDQLRLDIRSGAIRSVRDVERSVLRRYVEGLTGGRASRSSIAASRKADKLAR